MLQTSLRYIAITLQAKVLNKKKMHLNRYHSLLVAIVHLTISSNKPFTNTPPLRPNYIVKILVRKKKKSQQRAA